MIVISNANFCLICGDPVIGRRDKVFCTIDCKNKYHATRKSEIQPFSQPVDKILHRNWVILSEYYELARKKKFFISKAELNKAGFHSKYFTTIHTNARGKTYYYVYNFGWMEFSEKEMMIVRLNKSR